MTAASAAVLDHPIASGESGKPPNSPQQLLRVAQDTFIRRWGEMGATWGINRTMAEIHALLYITGQPQCTDDVMDRLNISRGTLRLSEGVSCGSRYIPSR